MVSSPTVFSLLCRPSPGRLLTLPVAMHCLGLQAAKYAAAGPSNRGGWAYEHRSMLSCIQMARSFKLERPAYLVRTSRSVEYI
jgi:hypothetical protein